MDTTTDIIVDPTEQVVADMLTENTGRHFLDSGGAYGRSWERNQGIDVAAWKASPEVTLNQRDGWATISLFHYLTNRVEYDAQVDGAWRKWIFLDADRTTNGGDTLDDWLTAMVDKGWAVPHREFGMAGGYTYNEENALSQDFLWRMFTLTEDCPYSADFEYSDDPDERGSGWEQDYVAISIHGGCDARAGFTDWRIFRLDEWEYFFDWSDYEVLFECDAPGPNPNQPDLFTGELPPPFEPCQVYTSIRGGYGEWYDINGEDIDEPAELYPTWAEQGGHPGDEMARECPCGKGTLHYHDVYVHNSH